MDGVSIHHQLKSAALAHLEKNPEKQRSKEEIEELDKNFEFLKSKLEAPLKNKHKKLKRLSSHSGSFSDDDEEEDYDDDMDASGGGYFNAGVNGPNNNGGFFNFAQNLPVFGGFGFGGGGGGGGGWGMVQAVPVKCRNCDVPHADGFQCAVHNPAHISCSFCHQLLPDRGLPNVTCAGCKRICCKDYYGNCGGLNSDIQRVKDINGFPFNGLPALLLVQNSYETNVLKNYLVSKNILPNEFWKNGFLLCLLKMFFFFSALLS